MESLAVILILISGVSHTVWNFIGKNVSNTIKSFFWALIFYGLIYLIPYAFMPDKIILVKAMIIPGLISAVFNAVMFWCLQVAYRKGDLSYVYPLKNALPIVYTTAFALVIGNFTDITPKAFIGFFCIIVGCLLLPLRHLKNFNVKNYFGIAALFAAIAALGTAGYSVIDSNIMKAVTEADPTCSKIQAALLYTPVQGFGTALLIWPFMFVDRKFFGIDFTKEKVNYPLAALMGFLIATGYILVLTAYSLADNVSYIVAFRQIGMPLSILAGILFMKEKPYFGKIAGGLIIIIGLVLTALK